MLFRNVLEEVFIGPEVHPKGIMEGLGLLKPTINANPD
jgi:hypothetical protein